MSSSPLHNNPLVDLYLLRAFQNKTHLSITQHILQHLTQNDRIFSSFIRNIIKKRLIPKGLKKLTLDLKEVHLNRQNIKEIFQYLFKKLRDIEHFKIILSPDPFRQDKYFKLLLKTLRTFRSLKTFEVALPIQFEGIYQKFHLSDLIKALKRSVPRLKEAKFTYIYDTSWGILGKGIPILKEWGIKRLGSLQSLSLRLPTSIFLDQGKLDLLALKGLTRLKYLDIRLIDLPGDHSSNISKELAFDPRKVFPQLKKFKWSVLHNSLTETPGIAELFGPEIAGRLERLEDFALKFRQDGELINQDTRMTTQCLTSLKTDLNQFSLKLNLGKLNSNDSSALIEALEGQRLKNIHTLSLEFIQCKGLSDVFLAKLGKSLGQNMKELRFLRLCFEKSHSLSNSFTKKLKTFFGFKAVSSQGICKLGFLLSEGCGNLELIWLEFLGYPQISDRGAMDLCDNLSKMSSLKKVRLRFKSCPKVTDASINHAKNKFGSQRDVNFTLK